MAGFTFDPKWAKLKDVHGGSGIGNPSWGNEIASMPGVKGAVHKAAKELFSAASAQLAAHRSEGKSRIELRRGSSGKDYYVLLVDPDGAALSIEFGNSYQEGVAPLRVGMAQVAGRRAGR